jgi:hypothetical protein
MSAFDGAWDLMKYEIPMGSIGYRYTRPDHPGWKQMSFVDDPSSNAPGYFVPPIASKGLDWLSAINLKPIISRVTGVKPNEKFDRELSDREIEDIIEQVGIIALHEGSHIALHPIIEQILEENAPIPDSRSLASGFGRHTYADEMGDSKYAYPYYQEFGAHTASSDYKNRLQSPKQSRADSQASSKADRNKHMMQEFPRKRMQEGFTYDEAMADNHSDFHEDSRRYRLRDMHQEQRGDLI